MQSEIVKCALNEEQIYNHIFKQSHQGAYVSYIRGKRCVSLDAFFCEISASFQFPYYFGENWAALDECLCDLEWLQFDSISIVVDNFSTMFTGDDGSKNLLVKYLTAMVNYWKENDVSVTVLLNN